MHTCSRREWNVHRVCLPWKRLPRGNIRCLELLDVCPIASQSCDASYVVTRNTLFVLFLFPFFSHEYTDSSVRLQYSWYLECYLSLLYYWRCNWQRSFSLFQVRWYSWCPNWIFASPQFFVSTVLPCSVIMRDRPTKRKMPRLRE